MVIDSLGKSLEMNLQKSPAEISDICSRCRSLLEAGHPAIEVLLEVFGTDVEYLLKVLGGDIESHSAA